MLKEETPTQGSVSMNEWCAYESLCHWLAKLIIDEHYVTHILSIYELYNKDYSILFFVFVFVFVCLFFKLWKASAYIAVCVWSESLV